MHSRGTQQQSKGPAAGKPGHGHDALHADMRDRMPDYLRSELDGLRKHESKIMSALKNDDMARLFLSDPRAALHKMKVPLSPMAKVALSNVRLPGDLLQPKAYRLPNGQTITPKVTIRFTKEE
jgi:hypothetical protein